MSWAGAGASLVSASAVRPRRGGAGRRVGPCEITPGGRAGQINLPISLALVVVKWPRSVTFYGSEPLQFSGRGVLFSFRYVARAVGCPARSPESKAHFFVLPNSARDRNPRRCLPRATLLRIVRVGPRGASGPLRRMSVIRVDSFPGRPVFASSESARQVRPYSASSASDL